MRILSRYLGVDRYRADERYRAALSAYGKRDLKTAMAQINASIELLPTHAEYHAALGYFLLEGKDRLAAKQAFERALNLYPYEMLANYGLGMIAYREKDWRRAEARFTDSLAAQPDRAETHFYRAMVSHRLGRNDEARDRMAAAAERFAKAEDQRVRHCHAWIREFERLI